MCADYRRYMLVVSSSRHHRCCYCHGHDRHDRPRNRKIGTVNGLIIKRFLFYTGSRVPAVDTHAASGEGKFVAEPDCEPVEG